MPFPTPFLALLLTLLSLFHLTISTPAPTQDIAPQPETYTQPPPPPLGGSPNDGYGDIPPPPATIPSFPWLGPGGILPSFTFPLLGLTIPGLGYLNPASVSLLSVWGVAELEGDEVLKETWDSDANSCVTQSTKTGGGVVVTPGTSTKSTDPGVTLSGYTFSPSPLPSTTATSGVKTTDTVGGITGPSNPTSDNVPPVTVVTDPCVKASVSLSVVTAVSSLTYSTHVVQVSYVTVVQPVTSYTTIVQSVAVTVPSLGVSLVTGLSTFTRSICLAQTTVTSTKTAGGGTDPSLSSGTATTSLGGGGGGGGTSSTCVWAAPTVTGGYTISASAVIPGATNQGVSGFFSGNPASSVTNLYLGQSVPLPYAEYKCSLLCEAGCASFYVGFATSGNSYYCYTYTSLLTPLDLISLNVPPATTIIFGAAFNKLCSGTPPSSSPGGGGGTTSTTKTADGGFTTLASTLTSGGGRDPGGPGPSHS